MRQTVILLVALLPVVCAASPASPPPAAARPGALATITFSSRAPKQSLSGFGNPLAEIGRYETLQIVVPATFASDVAARHFPGVAPASLVEEIRAFSDLASALRGYTSAIAAAAAKSVAAGGSNLPAAALVDISQDPAVDAAREPLKRSLETFIDRVQPRDPARFGAVSHAFALGYPAVAKTLQQEIEDLDARLAAQLHGAAMLGMTASIVPLEADARPLHLPGYDNIAQAAVAATPNFIPVVDDRTREEANAAQTLADLTKQLGQVGPEIQSSVLEQRKTLEALRKQLKTDVLEEHLDQLEQDIGIL